MQRYEKNIIATKFLSKKLFDTIFPSLFDLFQQICTSTLDKYV